MEYTNPVSIAGMANGPQGEMLPGTGAGPLDMMMRNQALGQAYDFLDMSKAAGAQDYVKGQWDMQTKHDQYGLDKQAKQLGNQTAEQNIRMNEGNIKFKDEQLNQLRSSGQLNRLALVGSVYEPFVQAKGPLEQKAVIDQAKQLYARMHPDDPSGLQDFDQFDGTPEGKERMARALWQARHIATSADQAFRQKQSLQGDDIQSREGMQRNQLRSNESEGAADRASAERIAGMRAEVMKLTGSGGNAKAKYQAEVMEAIIAAEEKKLAFGEKSLTAKEQAVLKHGPRMVESAYSVSEHRNDPEVISRGEEAKGEGKGKGIRKMIDNISSPSPKTVSPEKHPNSSIQEAIEAGGYDYEPDFYDYRVENGVVLRKKKGE